MKKEKKTETPNGPVAHQPLDDLKSRFAISISLRQAENEIDKMHQELILTLKSLEALQAEVAAKDQEIAALKSTVEKLKRVVPGVEAPAE